MKKEVKNVSTVYLNQFELNELFMLNLSTNPSLQKVRDMFIVGAYTGIKLNDIYQVISSNLKHNPDCLTNRQLKVPGRDGKETEIYMKDIVFQVLLKYQFRVPVPVGMDLMNSSLKNICKMVDSLKKLTKIEVDIEGRKEQRLFRKYELVSVFAARKSYVAMMLQPL